MVLFLRIILISAALVSLLAAASAGRQNSFGNIHSSDWQPDFDGQARRTLLGKETKHCFKETKCKYGKCRKVTTCLTFEQYCQRFPRDAVCILVKCTAENPCCPPRDWKRYCKWFQPEGNQCCDTIKYCEKHKNNYKCNSY